ncbi:type I polyketide synthase [Paenibacillus kobensis]|uniref:type I polyketide synthase n=1 Tax=Paenibacillus kobensis TaxID=59841 RepID=UPI000FDB8D13|nr:beta-ketoacyl synthase N-terminal-like domain-containing protein [Paenibacillus kobensis]
MLNNRENIEIWLRDQVAARFGIGREEVDASRPFSYYGIDSAEAMIMCGDMEQLLGREVPPTMLWDYPTIHELAGACVHIGESHGQRAETAEEQERILKPAAREPIAIVGIGCRFPGADGPAAFWRLLREGIDAVGPYPASREALGRDISFEGPYRQGGYLEGIDRFDYKFFHLSYREAVRMDPQQRALLEVTWEAFEDAGIIADEWADTNAGVFIGISNSDYGRSLLSDPEQATIHAVTGSAFSIAANRLSYAFDLRGPSLAVDTACSSSLAALHLACQSIWQGDSDRAIAGGANLLLSASITDSLDKAGMLAPDDRCKSFDQRADGYVRGEGCGVLLLKPLSMALNDKDEIYAVIPGSAMNQDGRSNGLTAPNRLAQERVLKDAYRSAGIAPAAVRLVEAHGTGTYLGDPIEAEALSAVLGAGRPRNRTCWLGSVKTNIGHLESAAGIAGVIKAALAIKHRQIPASLHYTGLNPHISLEKLPLAIPASLMKWPDDGPAVAGVSSFGFGGTNAHVVLTEPPYSPEGRGQVAAAAAYSTEPKVEQQELLFLSARTAGSLRQLAAKLAKEIPGTKERALGEVCRTLSTSRKRDMHRLALTASNREQLAERLLSFASGQPCSGISSGTAKPDAAVWILFPDAGERKEASNGYASWQNDPQLEQPIAMLSRLYEDRFGEPPSASPRAELFILQLAMCQWLQRQGVQAAGYEGTGGGKLAAACISGETTLEEALLQLRTEDTQPSDLEEPAPPWPADGANAVVIVLHPELGEAELSMAGQNRPAGAVLAAAGGTGGMPTLALAGKLFAAGADIRHPRDREAGARGSHMLPTYAWETESCWPSNTDGAAPSFVCFC